jgi:MoaA/NifB/PqqE/SkfB family radical SAM enzyme
MHADEIRAIPKTPAHETAAATADRDASRFLTGLGKALVYVRILAHVPLRYALRPGRFASPMAYVRFLARALRLLLAFRHGKVVRIRGGYKLHLYLPAYPSPAFFHAIESKLLRTPPGPTTVVLSMTRACSFRCAHCYQRHDRGADLDEARLVETARQVRDAGVAYFNIEGGEPFLRFPRLLALLRSLDARTEVWVNSTGAHRKPGMLGQLREAGLAGVMVSVHSPDPATHDAFTGVPGSFRTAAGFLRECRALGLGTALNTVLSEEDVRRGALPRLMDLARDLDVDFVQLIHPKPAGTWLGRTEQMQTDPAVLERIRDGHRLYNSGRRKDHPALAAQVQEETAETFGCTAGAVDRFYVNAAGEVQPCEFLNVSFGNVNDEPFETVFARMRSFFPAPGTDWLCCTQAAAIQALLRKHGLARTPLPWPVTRELVSAWDRGTPTPLYAKLGIYK